MGPWRIGEDADRLNVMETDAAVDIGEWGRGMISDGFGFGFGFLLHYSSRHFQCTFLPAIFLLAASSLFTFTTFHPTSFHFHYFMLIDHGRHTSWNTMAG
jgi:hypothetical protein